MFTKRVPLWTVFAAVGLVLAIVGIGSAIQSAAWTQGFNVGLLAGGGEAASLLPYISGAGAGAVATGGGILSAIFGFFGAVFRIVFFFIVLGIFFKMLGFLRWQRKMWKRMQQGDGGPQAWQGSWQGHNGWHGGPPWMHKKAPNGRQEQESVEV